MILAEAHTHFSNGLFVWEMQEVEKKSPPVKKCFDYYAFGLTMPGRSSNSANPNDTYKFTGHEFDDEAGLDLYYMIARGYDPVIGRFLQIDPMLQYSSPYTYVGNNPLAFIDPTGMLGEFFDGNGRHLGSDGIDDGKVYIANKGQSRSVKKALKKGGSENIASAQASSTEIPGLSVLNESLNVLDRTVANGGLREEGSLVMNDGSVVQGETGPLPTIVDGVQTAETKIPALPEGSSDSDVSASIHSHPTTVQVEGGLAFPQSALNPSDADKSAFRRFGTNIIAGPLGQATINRNSGAINQKPLGIAVFNRSAGLRITVTRKALKRIVNKLK